MNVERATLEALGVDPDAITLIGAPPSPFVRRARVALAERNLAYTLLDAHAWDASPAVVKLLPALKVPGVIADGQAFFDSRVIVEFADTHPASTGPRLLPEERTARLEVRTAEALADGLLEAAVLVRVEGRRAQERRSEAWMEWQLGKVRAALPALNSRAATRTGEPDAADLVTAVAVAYLSERFPEIEWRSLEGLAHLSDRMEARPAFRATPLGTMPGGPLPVMF